jgi:hypothetical protein
MFYLIVLHFVTLSHILLLLLHYVTFYNYIKLWYVTFYHIRLRYVT